MEALRAQGQLREGRARLTNQLSSLTATELGEPLQHQLANALAPDVALAEIPVEVARRAMAAGSCLSAGGAYLEHDRRLSPCRASIHRGDCGKLSVVRCRPTPAIHRGLPNDVPRCFTEAPSAAGRTVKPWQAHA